MRVVGLGFGLAVIKRGGEGRIGDAVLIVIALLIIDTRMTKLVGANTVLYDDDLLLRCFIELYSRTVGGRNIIIVSEDRTTRRLKVGWFRRS